jgi:hypothetical protein
MLYLNLNRAPDAIALIKRQGRGGGGISNSSKATSDLRIKAISIIIIKF